MKKLLVLLAAILTISVSAKADGLCATLQHGDQMTAYYGADAFKEAYNAAADGDVITLSTGTFNSGITIAKSIKIFGAYGFSDDATKATRMSYLTLKADSIHLEGVYFGLGYNAYVMLDSIKDCTLRRCYFNYGLKPVEGKTNVNTIVDQCYVNQDLAIGNSVNYTIKNSTIYCFQAVGSSANKANILNNVVYWWRSNTPYGIYKNNILGVDANSCESATTSGSTKTYPYSVPNVGEFYYNVFVVNQYDSSYTYTLNPKFSTSTPNSNNIGSGMKQIFNVTGTNQFTYPVSSYTTTAGDGQDGTRKGPFGGTGFTYNPAIPRITASEIDARTDAEGKLNVKITVTAK